MVRWRQPCQVFGDFQQCRRAHFPGERNARVQLASKLPAGSRGERRVKGGLFLCNFFPGLLLDRPYLGFFGNSFRDTHGRPRSGAREEQAALLRTILNWVIIIFNLRFPIHSPPAPGSRQPRGLYLFLTQRFNKLLKIVTAE